MADFLYKNTDNLFQNTDDFVENTDDYFENTDKFIKNADFYFKRQIFVDVGCRNEYIVILVDLLIFFSTVVSICFLIESFLPDWEWVHKFQYSNRKICPIRKV